MFFVDWIFKFVSIYNFDILADKCRFCRAECDFETFVNLFCIFELLKLHFVLNFGYPWCLFLVDFRFAMFSSSKFFDFDILKSESSLSARHFARIRRLLLLRCGLVRPVGGFALRVRLAGSFSQGPGGHFRPLREFPFRALQVVDLLRDRWLPPLWGWT